MDKATAEKQLEQWDFTSLFIETLGWDRFNAPSRVTRIEPGQRGLGPGIQGIPLPKPKPPAVPEQQTYHLRGVAQKRGIQVYVCSPDVYGLIPNYPIRCYIQTQVAKQARENLIIYTDSGRSAQVWQWVRRAEGETATCEHIYAPGEADGTFLRRLTRIAFALEEEAGLTLLDVLAGLQAAFYVARSKVCRGPYSRLRLWEYDFNALDPALAFWMERAYICPRLTRLQERQLFRDIARGSEQAREQVIEAHLYLVAEMAWKLNTGARLDAQDLLDVIQEGHIRLIRAVEIFDVTRGLRFQTLAASHIRRRLDRAFLEQSRSVRIPPYLGDILPDILSRFEEEEAFQRQERQQDPEPEEVAQAITSRVGVTAKQVLHLRKISQGCLSLNALVDEWNDEQQDSGGRADRETLDGLDALSITISRNSSHSPSDNAVNLIRREQLDAVLNNLTPRERDVVRMRYGLNNGYTHTLEEVGQRFAVTRERVRQIEIRALKKLRRMGPADIQTEEDTIDGS